MADLSVEIGGITFRNPVLPAAGPNVRTERQMLEAVERGAGGIVTKTVSVVPADFPRPCISKVPYDGLLNCETWSEDAFESCLEVYRRISKAGVPLICSIGYQPDDVRKLAEVLEREVQPDFIEFSTHYTGKSLEPLKAVARAIREVSSCPIWMKVSPSTPDISLMAAEMSDCVDGFVAINSVGPALNFDIEDPRPLLGSVDGEGWLSGPPIHSIALYSVYQIASAQDKPVIGVGGISTGEDAIRLIMAGASLVGICTAAIRGGTGTYGRVAEEMATWMDDHGYDSIEEIRGLYRRNLKTVRA